jgi:outer membrane protein OmpA-like peptidoglycan-associated protein
LLTALARDEGLKLEAATAQASYDCWLFAMANALGDRQASCASQSEASLNAIETAVAEDDLGALVMRPMWQRILFDTDKSDLDGGEQLAFNGIKERLSFLSGSSIHITGNADQPGTREYNLELSNKRAETVRAALIEAGIPAGAISAEAFGEDHPLANNPYDTLNRRVDIALKPLAVNEAAVKNEIERRRSQ